ncbi:MAG: enoyl-CoA hydratase/isomerase family protein, partial [Microbacterium sp.]
DPTSPSELVLLFDETPEPSALQAERAWIDEVFSAATVGEIVQRLSAHAEVSATAAAATLAELSPTALAVTLDAVREAREGDLRDALIGEYRRVMWFATQHPDLAEGIRAQLVDKDRSPKWRPATIPELTTDAGAAAVAFVPHMPLF